MDAPRRLPLACLLALAAARVRAGAGVAGADVLKIPVEARGWGLGMAYAAIVDDVGAMAYNPAGMSLSGEREFRFTYLSMLAGSNLESMLLAWPLGRWGTIGGMLLLRQVPDVDNGASVTVGPATPVEASDTVYGGYLACRFSHLLPGVKFVSPFSLGIGLKSLKEKIASFSAGTTAVDIGLLATFDVIRIALVGQNLGGGFTFPGTVEAEADEMPSTVRAGVAVVPYEDSSASLTVAVEDISYLGVSSTQKFSTNTITASESLDQLALGVEYWRLKKMGVRLGYVHPYGTGGKTFSGGRGLAMGVSFRMFTQWLAYQVDVGYRPLSLGSDRHDAATVSLGLRF